MKKTSTLVIVLCIVCAARAQTLSKGTTLLGGTIGFNSQKSKPDNAEGRKDNVLNINPSIGKFYRDNRMAGVNVFYGHSKSDGNRYKSDSYGVGAFLRQYLALGKSFYLFAEENLSFSRFTSAQQQLWSGANNEKKQSSINLNLYPGIAYKLNKRLFAELALNNLVNLNYWKEKQVDTYTDGSPTVKTNTNSLSLYTGLGNTALANLLFGLKWVVK